MNTFARIGVSEMFDSVSSCAKKTIFSFLDRWHDRRSDGLAVSEQVRQEPILMTSFDESCSSKRDVHLNLIDGEIRRAPSLHTDVHV